METTHAIFVTILQKHVAKSQNNVKLDITFFLQFSLSFFAGDITTDISKYFHNFYINE